VFRDPVYARSLRETLWDRAWEWVRDALARFAEAASGSRLPAWTVAALLTLPVAAIAARAAYLAWARRRLAVAGDGNGARDARRGGDPWLAAQDEAAAGRYADAAHLLYRSLLEALARRERLRLHPSKTVGDYARDLRVRSSPAALPFRDFARGYEAVVYGVAGCDREGYERLLRVAAGLARPDAR
jgi:hypothetical protein